MTVEIHSELRAVHDWHRLDAMMPLLNLLLNNIERDIDVKMLARDPGEPEYQTAAMAAWMERRALDKLKKELTKVVKKGKTASHAIANKL